MNQRPSRATLKDVSGEMSEKDYERYIAEYKQRRVNRGKDIVRGAILAHLPAGSEKALPTNIGTLAHNVGLSRTTVKKYLEDDWGPRGPQFTTYMAFVPVGAGKR